MKDAVFTIIKTMLSNSPEASYKRLNPALRSTLADCISADLPFQANTFHKIYHVLRGSWWFGDGSGSHVGEHFYTQACEVDHAGAQQSFEKFAGRPPVLWEENAKTPERLHVGSRFTWLGHFVTVTSMRADSLVACTYKDSRPSVRGLKPGATFYQGTYYQVLSAKRDGKATVVKVIPGKSDDRASDIAKRFTITYAEIKELRTTAKARVRAMLDKIAACTPAKDAMDLTDEINAGHFRHFELEEIQAAFKKRRDWIASQDKINLWREGEGDSWLDVKETLVRVNGDRVECSNGNAISKSTAASVLPVLMEHRKQTRVLDIPVDSFRLNGVSPDGVTIGCTVIPWPEIERIIPQLQS